MKTEDQNQSAPFDKGCTCMEMLQSVVDGQATQEQMAYFQQHMQHCAQCSTNYQLDTTLQLLVKNKCCGDHPPADLAEKIKDQIRKLS